MDYAKSLTEIVRMNTITVEMVRDLRDRLQPGDEVMAEMWRPDTAGGTFGTEKITILVKYEHIALTNKGAVSWNDIAINNRQLLRRGV